MLGYKENISEVAKCRNITRNSSHHNAINLENINKN